MTVFSCHCTALLLKSKSESTVVPELIYSYYYCLKVKGDKVFGHFSVFVHSFACIALPNYLVNQLVFMDLSENNHRMYNTITFEVKPILDGCHS